MIKDLNKTIEQIDYRKELNFDALQIVANYLINSPKFITPSLINDLIASTGISELEAFKMLFVSQASLDVFDNPRHKQLYNEYFDPFIKELDAKYYASNPYYSLIKMPEVSLDNWTFTNQKYAPFEALVYDDIKVSDDFKEIPMFGYFRNEFVYPCVLQNHNEWMMVTPEETSTMIKSLNCASGDVITFGLGLGYYPFMASMKDNVRSMTIVELDSTVIELFEKYILPQFPHKEKIHVIQSDGFKYASEVMPSKNYTHAFVDMWHDVSDGLEMYVKMKGFEKLNPNTTFDYWIEDSLISRIRWYLFDLLVENEEISHQFDIKTEESLKKFLSTDYLKEMAAVLTPFLAKK